MVNYQEVFYNYNDETGQVDTTYGDIRRYNSRQNFYFKPIVTVRDVWSLSPNSTLTTTAYASFEVGEVKHWRARQARGLPMGPSTCKEHGILTSCSSLAPMD